MPSTIETNSKQATVTLKRDALQEAAKLTAIPRLQIPKETLRVQSPEAIAIGSTNSTLTSSPISAGCLLCEASLEALSEKKLEVKVENVLSLNEASSVAVFRIYANLDGKESRPIGRPIVVPGVGTVDYSQNKEVQIASMLDMHATFPPKSINPQSEKPILIDIINEPELWSALDSGQRIIQGDTRNGFNGTVIETLSLEDSKGNRSAPVYIRRGSNESGETSVELLRQLSKNLARSPDTRLETQGDIRLSAPVVAMGNNWSAILQEDLRDYYCEHMAYSVQREAEYAPNCSILRNANSEPLSGFIHVPSDQFSAGEKALKSEQMLLRRHAETTEVLASGIRGYYADARPSLTAAEPFRVLVTGYDKFTGTKDNQTGELAVHVGSMERAITSAFSLAEGRSITHEVISDDPRTIKLSSQIIDPANALVRNLEVIGVNFPVNDSAISGRAGSVQSLIREQGPHAVISMGSSPPKIVLGAHRLYQLSHRCDDAQLRKDGGGAQKRETGAARVSLPENRSLARAIYRGSVLRAEAKK
jgi:hypothetical protein